MLIKVPWQHVVSSVLVRMIRLSKRINKNPLISTNNIVTGIVRNRCKCTFNSPKIRFQSTGLKRCLFLYRLPHQILPTASRHGQVAGTTLTLEYAIRTCPMSFDACPGPSSASDSPQIWQRERRIPVFVPS
jgi:hypothetical protein